MSRSERAAAPRKVLIVDDHPIMRQGLAGLIGQEADLVVCGEAEDAHGALEAVERHRPDVALVDISLKDSSGTDLIKDLRIRHPNLPVLVLSMHDESFYAERALRAGARGYVTKAEASAKVIEGLRKVLDGEVYLSDKVAAQVLTHLVGGEGKADSFPIDRLSDREFEVFELIGQGMEVRQIAEQLHLSPKTVESHREHIKKKLSIDSATELLTYAVRWVQSERGA